MSQVLIQGWRDNPYKVSPSRIWRLTLPGYRAPCRDPLLRTSKVSSGAIYIRIFPLALSLIAPLVGFSLFLRPEFTESRRLINLLIMSFYASNSIFQSIFHHPSRFSRMFLGIEVEK